MDNANVIRITQRGRDYDPLVGAISAGSADPVRLRQAQPIAPGSFLGYM